MMQSVLLKLYPAKIMHVGGVPLHFLEHELDLSLGDHVLLVDADNPGTLPEFARSAAPARPDAKAQAIDRQPGCRNHINDTDQRLHSVDLATHILAQHAALQVGSNR